MKSKKYALMALVLVIVILLTATVASAKGTRIYFTGSEWCDPDIFIFARVWESGPNVHLDGITQTCYDTASIPQLTGTDYLFDARINLVGGGPNFILSGKLRMESDEGGCGWAVGCCQPTLPRSKLLLMGKDSMKGNNSAGSLMSRTVPSEATSKRLATRFTQWSGRA